MHTYKTEVVVIGAGLAGIATALELLDLNVPVVLLDGAPEGKPGGQANEAFGGMLLSNTAEQARNRIKDSPELLLADWLRAGEFQADDHWPKAWATLYAEQCTPMIYQWLIAHGIRFFPLGTVGRARSARQWQQPAPLPHRLGLRPRYCQHPG